MNGSFGWGCFSAVPIGRYFYDGEGKRVKKITDTETTVFDYSSGKLIAEYSTQVSQTPSIAYTTTDHLGTPRVITNELGQVKARRDFMPFGEELYTGIGDRSTSLNYGTSQDDIRQKFTGYQKDNETGLDFAEARMYANELGRFTAVDPLLASGRSANPQTFNRYVYVSGNPLIRTDPTGLDWYRQPIANSHRFTYKWFDENPGPDWSAVDFGDNLYFQIPDWISGGTPMGTGYLDRYANKILTQSEYNDFLNRPLSLGCAGFTNACLGNPAALFDQARGLRTGAWNFLAGTLNAPIEAPLFNGLGFSCSAREVFGLPLILDYAEYQNKAEAQSAFQTQGLLTVGSFAAGGGIANSARASRFGAITPEAVNGARLDFLTEGQIARIQGWANKRNTEVTLFGSRAKGTANATSDFDYFIEASYKLRNNEKFELPRGPVNSGKHRIDVLKPSSHPDFYRSVLEQPHIIFRPN